MPQIGSMLTSCQYFRLMKSRDMPQMAFDACVTFLRSSSAVYPTFPPDGDLSTRSISFPVLALLRAEVDIRSVH